ncbi:MAG: hypothetical protein MSIBF_03740 [Candidatus Altiarchaeales archaeon IMC4]|nr:MAG: hypothetical protein MSIBF_03740 [Candidatus Altiarchaeales archaeon IMC4]
MAVACNSSPLIAMSKIGLLDILKSYFKEVYISEAVYNEVVIDGGDLFGATEVRKACWIKTRKVRNKAAVNALCMSIHKGEAETIILADELNADLVVMDDLYGKHAAQEMGLKAIGTLGILVKAASDDKINLPDTLGRLRSSGFWISDELYDGLLEL